MDKAYKDHLEKDQLEAGTQGYSATPLLLFLVHVFLFSSSSSSSASVISLTSDSDKVSVALYYESLCPYSADFIINYLTKLFDDDLISIVDLPLVPWENTKLRGNNTIDCQHGPYECLLNTVEACAIDIWPQLRQYPEWESCFEKLVLDSKLIADCYTSGHGKELELEYAAETNSLHPPHKYVPWVVVDGQPLYEDYENFISYVCKAYRGSTILKACSELSIDKIIQGKSTHPVCYKETTVPSLSS
ncbi:hypothetical protein SLEP1_g20993 [Rubroshorea leprosula]|uniref:Gamma-interferon-inducible lysosomal thiol reductase n=1 Tax=Rubroshorea leprosula TaxID=152421 RepID=A0AAV5J7R2_9ROSI|nr:hypothetical protein SLEP1_g20993 [Rubroshorea leprosula]